MTNVIDKSWFFNEVKKDNEEERMHQASEQEILETLGMTVWQPVYGMREFVVDGDGNEIPTASNQDIIDVLSGYDE